MGYSSGMLNHKVEILKAVGTEGKFGPNSGKMKLESLGVVSANVTWKKGQKSLNVGAMDAVDTILIRMRWNPITTRDSLIRYEGVTYQIQNFHADFQDNTIQITATETVVK